MIVHAAGIICDLYHSEFNEEAMKNLRKIHHEMEQKSIQKASKIVLGTVLELSWRIPRRHGGVQDPFKSEELVFALTLERNGHSGEKW